MKESLAGVDPSSLARLKVGTEWTEIQLLTDPFVVYRNSKYLPAVLVEEISTENKCILFVSAISLSEFLEPLRETHGALVGLNIRIRKKGEARFSTSYVENLAE